MVFSGPNRGLPALRRLRGCVAALLLAPALAAAAVPGAPAAPTVLLNQGEVQVTITAPLSDGGSPLTAYAVASAPAGGVDDHAGTLSDVHRITGLVPGQTYTFTVRASNADGQGPASPASAPYRHPVLARVSIADLDIPEGTGGDHTVRVPVTLSPAPESAFTLNAYTQQYTAEPGSDFVSVPWASIPIAAGQTEAFVDVVVHGDNEREQDESFRVDLRASTTGEFELARGSGTITLRNDDTVVAMQTRRDRYVYAGGSDQHPLMFKPMANDVFAESFLAGAKLTVLQLPENGQVRIFPPTGPGGSTFEYVPDAGFQGSERFAYRVCNAAGDTCVRGDIEVVVRPQLDMDMPMAWRSFGFTVERSQLGPRIGTRFVATPLVAGRTLDYALPANHSPERIWDGPETARWSLATLPAPADGKARRVHLLADARAPVHTDNVDLYVGIDNNGDGLPQDAEVVCGAATHTHEERCDVELEQGGTQAIRYWTMVQNIGTTPVDVKLDVFEVPAVPGNGSLNVTGPGLIADEGIVKMFYGADDATRLDGESRAGFVQMYDEDGRVGPPSPVRVDGGVMAGVAYLVTPGKPLHLRMAPGQLETGLFFDVPANATRLRVETRSAGEIDLKLQTSTAYEPSDYTTVWTNQKQLRGSAQAPGGNETLEIATPVAGRWFADLRNAGTDIAAVELIVTVDGSAPSVRPGSYFNPGRPGSGLFLSPAGNSLAGLWYTYLGDNRPTWYYLEGLKPGPNGIWTSPLYRSA